MSGRFQDQVAIVTGAVGGIGSAIVEGFLAEGGRVGLVDFNSQAGQAFEKELRKHGHQVAFVHADVAHYDQCQAAYDRITSELGAATILVNNVGISPKTDGRALKVWEMPPGEWDNVVSVNLNSVF